MKREVGQCKPWRHRYGGLTKKTNPTCSRVDLFQLAHSYVVSTLKPGRKVFGSFSIFRINLVGAPPKKLLYLGGIWLESRDYFFAYLQEKNTVDFMFAEVTEGCKIGEFTAEDDIILREGDLRCQFVADTAGKSL